MVKEATPLERVKSIGYCQLPTNFILDEPGKI